MKGEKAWRSILGVGNGRGVSPVFKRTLVWYAFTNRLFTFAFFLPVHDHVADETYALARAIPNDEYSYARVFPGKSGDAPLTVLIFLGFTLI